MIAATKQAPRGQPSAARRASVTESTPQSNPITEDTAELRVNVEGGAPEMRHNNNDRRRLVMKHKPSPKKVCQLIVVVEKRKHKRPQRLL